MRSQEDRILKGGLRISAAAKAKEKRMNVIHGVLVIEILKICKMQEAVISVCRKHLPLELGWDVGKHIKYSKHGAGFYSQFTWISVLGGKHTNPGESSTG